MLVTGKKTLSEKSYLQLVFWHFWSKWTSWMMKLSSLFNFAAASCALKHVYIMFFIIWTSTCWSRVYLCDETEPRVNVSEWLRTNEIQFSDSKIGCEIFFFQFPGCFGGRNSWINQFGFTHISYVHVFIIVLMKDFWSLKLRHELCHLTAAVSNIFG